MRNMIKSKAVLKLVLLFVVTFLSAVWLHDTLTVSGTADYPEMGLNGNSVSDIYNDKQDNQVTVQTPAEFQNPSFESPDITMATAQINESNSDIKWSTSYATGSFNILTDFLGDPAAEGNQWVSLTATAADTDHGTMYQDITYDFIPGQEITYSFYIKQPSTSQLPQESVKFIAGLPGLENNQGEVENVVEAGGYVSDNYTVTNGEGWKKIEGTFVVPSTVTNVIRVAIGSTSEYTALKAGTVYLDEVYFGVSTSPLYGNTIEIIPNSKYVANDAVSNRTATNVKIDLNRVADLSDVKPISQSIDVILPAGATTPTSASVYYDGNTSASNSLTITPTGTNTFTLTGLDDALHGTISILFDTTFTDTNVQPEVLANYNYSSEEIYRQVTPHNVWGIDNANVVEEFILSFDVNNAESGTKPNDQILAEGDNTSDPLSTDLVRNGYTFMGWNTETGGAGIHWDFNTMKMPANDTVLYAEWKSDAYNAYFDLNGAPGTNPATQSVNVGEFIPDPGVQVWTGYTFKGWYNQSDGSGQPWNFASDVMPTNDITLYAAWEKDILTLTYNLNGAPGVAPTGGQIAFDDPISAPADPIWDGHTFTGWYTAATGGTKWDFNTMKMPATNLELFAVWDTQNYQMSFDLNGGTGTAPAAQNLDFGTKATKPTDPIRTGYSFKAWTINQDGSGAAWDFNNDTMPANDVILFAQWDKNILNLTYNLNGAPGNAPVGGQIAFDDPITAPADPIWDGHTFTGWYTASSGGTKWDFNTMKMPATDLELFAQWDTQSYQLSFDLNGATGTPPAAQNPAFGENAIAPADPTWAGYTFEGWNESQTGAGPMWNFNGNTMPAHNVILYAQWTPNAYDVLFSLNSAPGVAPVKQTILFEQKINKPIDPLWDGHTFNGWSESADGSAGLWNFDSDTMPARNIMLYAQWDNTIYTVTFDVNTGDSVAPVAQQVQFDGLITKPADPSKLGYDFVEWNTLANGTGTSWDFQSNKMPSENMTLYAIWKTGNFEASFDVNGAPGNPPSPQKVNFGDPILEPADPIYVGHTFEGWYNQAIGGTKWDFTTNTMPASNITLYAQWSTNTHIVHYDVNGGQSVAPVDEPVDFDALVTKPTDPVNQGYNFVGWNTEIDGTGKTWNFNTDKMPDEDLFLYAEWSVNSYVASFNLNGAPGTKPNDQPHDYGEKLQQPTDPVWPGYTFVNWNDKADGTGQVWSFVNDTMPASNLELFAIWDVNQYTVDYDLNGATGTIPNSETLDFGSKLTSPTDPIRPGYVFSGWNTANDGTGTNWNYASDTMLSKDFTLYATWDAQSYILTYDVNGGVGNVPAPTATEVDTKLTKPTNPTKTGYTFLGWNSQIDGGGQTWDFVNMVMPPNDLTLYAQWGVDVHTLKYDINGGDSGKPTDQIVEFGTTFTQPVDPIRAGYTLSAWNTLADGSGKDWNFASDTMPANDLTLFAQWTIVDYNVNFDANGAETPNPQSLVLNYGEKITKPQDPTYTGYQLVAWTQTKNVASTAWDFTNDTMPEADVTLYALWEMVDYTVSFDMNGATGLTPPKDQVLNFEDLVVEPTNPIRNGYSFVGWSKDAAIGSVLWDFSNDTMPANDLKLYAQWSMDELIVDPPKPGDTCITGNGTPDATVEIKDEFGNVIGSAVVDPNGNYEVCGLTPDSPGDIIVEQTDPEGNASTPIALHLVDYDTHGAETVTPLSQYVIENDYVTEPVDPTREFYEFLGWFTDAANGSEWLFKVNKMGTSNFTLHAQWQILPPIVDPIGPGDTCITGTGIPGATINVYDENGNLVGTTTVDDNGVYSVCNLNPDETGNINVDQTDPDGNVSEKVEFYPVVFEEQGATGNFALDQYLVAGSLITEPTDPTREFYEFIEWNQKSDGSGQVWDFATQQMPKATITLYGQWKILPPTVDPTNPGDTCIHGNGAPGAVIEVTDENGVVIGTTVVRPDGTYDVCNLEPDQTGNIDVDQSVPGDGSSESTKLYALVYDENGGTGNIPQDQYLQVNEMIIDPGVPTKEFNEFLGWNTKDDGTGTFVDYTGQSMPANNIYLYAQWKVLPPIVDPTEPGDSCIHGEGMPGATIEVTDSDGNVIGTTTVRPDGTYDVCDLNPDETGNIDVDQTVPGDGGGTSEPTKLYALVYDENGATANVPLDEYLQVNEQVVDQGIPTKVFNEFLGWNTKDDGTGTMINYAGQLMPANDVYLYAQWKVLPPIVDPTEPGDTCIHGEGMPGATIEVTDSDGNVIGTTTVNPDGTYDVCNLNPDETGNIDVDQTVPGGGGTSEPTKLYVVVYDENGATGNTPVDQYLQVNELIADPGVPTKEFNNFLGWNTKDDGSGSMIEYNGQLMPTNDVYLYAQWDILPPTVEPGGPDDTCIHGEGMPGATINVTDQNGDIIGTTTVRPDGTYDVCNLNPDESGNIDVDQTDPDGNVSEPTTLYAVTFNLNGVAGETPNGAYHKPGDLIVEPSSPNNQFYEFIGWSENVGDNGDYWIFNRDVMPSNDLVLYAQWRILAPTVDEVKPGDTCVTGTGIPGATIQVTDEFGNVIREGIVGPDGTYELCGDPIDNTNNITVTQTDPNGRESEPYTQVIKYPANDKPLISTGESIKEKLVAGLLFILAAFIIIIILVRSKKRA